MKSSSMLATLFVSSLLPSWACEGLAAAEDNGIQEYFDENLEAASENAGNDPADQEVRFYAQAPAADAATTTAPPVTSEGASVTDDVTKPKATSKKKKLKKVAIDGAKSLGEGGDVAMGHGAQESGAPYSANVGLGLSYESSSETKTYSDKSLKSTEKNMSIELKYLMIWGHFEVGPLFLYSKSTAVEPVDESKSITANISGLGVGGSLFYNFANVHQDKFVPYGGLNLTKVNVTSTSKTDGSTTESKSSSSNLQVGIELGVKYFMGGHVAIQPSLLYGMTVNGEDKSKDVITGDDLVASVKGSSLNLKVGLATYF